MGSETTEIIIAILKLLLGWTVFAAFLWVLFRAVGWVSDRVRVLTRAIGRNPRFRGLFALLGTQILAVLLGLVKLIAGIIVLVVASSVLTLSFSLFPATSHISTSLLEWVGIALHGVLLNVVGYLPNLGVLIVIIVITYYATKLIRVVFQGIEDQIISFRGFRPEWAEPTKDLLYVLVVTFALVVGFPYLPGGDSPAFRGISIFIGVLLSLGSGSAMGNMIAGVILTYMSPYKPGDRVKIGDTIGDVIAKNLLVTRLMTIKNVEVIVPNSQVLSNHIVNYSSEAQGKGLILHTTVTIGYDAPWRKVHELLVEAALGTEGVLPEPRPFVFQTALDDSYVSYELNAYTNRPNEMAVIYSALHANIQDSFNKGAIEIMSPTYYALRDGNYTTTPEESRPEGYRATGFRISDIGKPER